MPKPQGKPNEIHQQPGASQQISERRLKGLLKDHRALKQDMGELSGTFGSAIKDAAENHYLNRRAFRITAALDKLEPEKLADTLDSLDFYLDASGLRERAASAPRMEMEGREEEERDSTNVADFPSASVEA
jgi:hypothetical protein